MKTLCKLLAVSAITASLGIPVSSYATNGIFLMGYGAKSRGMGGASIAMAKDAVDAAINPAAAAYTGNRADAGVMLFNPQARGACCNSPGGEVSSAGFFVIPNLAGTMQYNKKINLGFSFMGYGGGGTDYHFNLYDSTNPGYPLGMDYSLAVMSPSAAYKINDTQSVGVGLLIGIQRFRAFGMAPFHAFSKDPNYMDHNAYDWSFGGGLRLGWQGHFMDDSLKLGAVYQTKMKMSKFKKYRGLFPNAGEMDVPGNVALGIAYKLMDKLTIAFDWQRTFYEDVPAIGNRTLPITTKTGSPNQLGGSSGPGFGWKNQDIFKLGAEYGFNKKWIFRAGVNYGKSQIRNDGGGEFEINIIAPAVIQWNLTAGGTYNLDKKQEISFAYLYAPKSLQRGVIPPADPNNPSGALHFQDETIELEMREYAVDISYGYKF